MTDPVTPDRPVPRWLHAWAVLTAAVTLVLLVLGQLVTSFRAGMADPVWPTEPWYLFVVGWQEPNRGYLIEHSHRIAGFVVGGLVSVLALGVWWTNPGKVGRWVGFAALIVLLAAFGDFHRQMIAQRDPSLRPTIPLAPVGVMGAALGLVVAIGLGGLLTSTRGSGLRLLAVVALVAVMIQGLLGGLRVRLDALIGPDFAMIHGVFAQVVFCLLVSVAVLTGRPAETELPAESRRTAGGLAVTLVGFVFVQLVWGAMVRHAPDALNQRLHILTAFAVVAAAVWLLRAAFANPAVRARVAAAAWVLGLLLAAQVALGVEAWMGKFGDEARRGKPASAFLPEAEQVTKEKAAIRTLHTLVGTGVLASAVALAIGVWRPSGSKPGFWLRNRISSTATGARNPVSRAETGFQEIPGGTT
jgi:heme A synthase